MQTGRTQLDLPFTPCFFYGIQRISLKHLALCHGHYVTSVVLLVLGVALDPVAADIVRIQQGQQALLAWFNEGDTRAYKIRFPNGTVDVFRGWVSSIGKAVTAKEVITRTVKVTNVGRPSMAEDRSTVTAATGMTVTPASTSVVKGQSTTLTVAFQPEGVTDKSFRAVSADKTKATVSVSGMTITVKGVAAGKVNIPVVSGNGELAVVAEITVTDS